MRRVGLAVLGLLTIAMGCATAESIDDDQSFGGVPIDAGGKGGKGDGVGGTGSNNAGGTSAGGSAGEPGGGGTTAGGGTSGGGTSGGGTSGGGTSGGGTSGGVGAGCSGGARASSIRFAVMSLGWFLTTTLRALIAASLEPITK